MYIYAILLKDIDKSITEILYLCQLHCLRKCALQILYSDILRGMQHEVH